MADFEPTETEEKEESSLPLEDLVEKRGPGRPKGSKNKPKEPEDPEAPPMLPSSEDAPRRRGRPPGSKNKAKSAKMPIPPSVVRAMGGAPFMLAGQVYGMRFGRSLDFTQPAEVAAMYQASLSSLEEWMKESGLEAPAWLVYAGTTASCIGMAMAVDQMKLKAELELAQSLRAKTGIRASPDNAKPASAPRGTA